MAKEGMAWQAKFLLKCSAGSWSWRLSPSHYLLSPLKVSFASCAAALTAVLPPEPAPHSTRAVWASREPQSVLSNNSSAQQQNSDWHWNHGCSCQQSILNLLRLLKCSKAAAPYLHRCATCTWQTQSPPFPSPDSSKQLLGETSDTSLSDTSPPKNPDS